MARKSANRAVVEQTPEHAADPPDRQFAARFRSIFNALPAATVFVDTERRIVMVNPAVEKIFGYTADEVIGRNTERFYAVKEDYEEQGSARYNPGALENAEPYRVHYRRKDGTVFPAETVGNSVRDDQGNIIGFLGMIRDITEEVEQETKLQEMQLQNGIIADFAYDWEYWQSPDETFRYVSPSCEDITGYPPGSFKENPALLQEIVLPEDLEIWENHRHDSMKEMKRREVEFRIIRRDGEVRWIEHACQPVVDSNNEFLGFRASNRDISLRKNMENELRVALKSINSLKEQLEVESSYLREEIALEHDHKNIIGESDALQYVLFKVEQIAASDTSVIILGETGTGKELIARAIHNASSRGSRSLVKVNCAALPAELIESELFGHEKGAFTGAHARHVGRFEVANGTSIFLDEIGELPLELQAKLLRVLQDGEFERLGSTRTIKVDVRIIAATNRNLEEDVRTGKFRRDLWYRLNVFPITVPPLRYRIDDIPQLVSHFLCIFNKKQGKDITMIPKAVMHALQKYSWPGNVRELENIIERAVISTRGSKLVLPEGLEDAGWERSSQMKTLREVERDYILQVLDKTNWKVSGRNSAAEILDIDRSTLRARMKKLDIQKR